MQVCGHKVERPINYYEILVFVYLCIDYLIILCVVEFEII
jgi:hypothetical protein